MIKELIHDPIFLAEKSEDATKEDLQVAQDLLDTLMAHKDSCVGMAANMIGVRKRIIAFLDESERAPTYTIPLRKATRTLSSGDVPKKGTQKAREIRPNPRVENQAGERVGVVSDPRLASQRTATPTAQGFSAF